MTITIKKPGTLGFAEYGMRKCQGEGCTATFLGRKHEELCRGCEDKRKQRTYQVPTGTTEGWTQLPSGGHMRNTIHRD